MNISLEEIVILGIHLGHPTHRWNPKIANYTYGIRDGIHLIDLVKSRQQLEKAKKFIIRIRDESQSILFVGTKSQATDAIKSRALASRGFFVNKRWLGGILTNWATIRASLLQLHRLEREKQLGTWKLFPKKKIILMRKRLRRLQSYLGGLKGMYSIPSAVVVVGQVEEITAIQECRKLDIPVVCRLDTDCDPSLAEVGVPINDDSRSSINLFLQVLLSGY